MRRLPSGPTTRWTLPSSVAALALAGGALAVVGVAPLAYDVLRPLSFTVDDSVPPPSSTELAAMLLGVALSTVTLLSVALGLSLRAKRWVAFKTVLWCMLFGWLNAATSLALGNLFRGHFDEILPGVVLGLFMGIFFATPFGLLYGLVAAVATHNLRALIDRPSLTSRLDAQRLVSLVVLGAAGFALVVRLGGYGVRVPVALPAAVFGLGAIGLAQALVRRYLLTRLARAPHEHGYERVALADLGIDHTGLWPLHPGVPADATHALVERESAGEGAYRGAAPRVPLALVE